MSNTGPLSVTLGVDYRAPSPLWIGGGNVADLTRLHLAVDLVSDLIAWQRHFDAHFSIMRWPNWDSREAAEWHAAEGPRLYERLRRALPERDIALNMSGPRL